MNDAERVVIDIEDWVWDLLEKEAKAKGVTVDEYVAELTMNHLKRKESEFHTKS